MESPDLNSPAKEDAAFEALLRDNAASAPLPDNGFSARVVAALPVSAHRYRTARQLSIAAAALAGLALAAAGVMTADFPSAWEKFTMLSGDGPTASALAIALGITAGSLWYAFRDRFRMTRF